MIENNIQELNEAAMQIILHAGNCRMLLTEALDALNENHTENTIKDKFKKAKGEIIIAHRIQTEMIQGSIENDHLETTLLFTHAQDTLMTINSELNIAHHIYQLYTSLKNEIYLLKVKLEGTTDEA